MRGSCCDIRFMYHELMRAVTTADAEEIAELEMKLFPANCFNDHTIAKEIEAGKGWCVVEEGEIVAYVLCRGNDYLLDIMRLGVMQKHQGKKLGVELLLRCILEAEHVMLTVHEQNERALRLYRRNGFEVVGRLADGNWVMGRTQDFNRHRRHFIGIER